MDFILKMRREGKGRLSKVGDLGFWGIQYAGYDLDDIKYHKRGNGLGEATHV